MNESTMSIWGLIINATTVVQLVMAGLLSLSVLSWVVVVQKWLVLKDAEEEVNGFEKRFWSGMDLSQLFREGSNKKAAAIGMENLFRAGFKEFTRLRQQPGIESDAVMEGAQRAMRVALAREEKALEKHLSLLATVASVSPYIGLFGTVWGIMHAFIGLANISQPSIGIVAQPIAEALIATAMGLFAAIPAVLFYNRYASQVDSVLHNYYTFLDEFTSILHRQAYSKRVQTTQQGNA
ncbi:MAG TPA: protein TolQ [Candidatus Acidoferrum sp.]|nr:protein TolQ [Candidatus Acidoferrum sp.]